MSATPPASPDAPVRSARFACTGSVRHSLLGELVLRDRVPGRSISSRDNHVLVGDGMDEQGVRLAFRGVSRAEFCSRQPESGDLGTNLALELSSGNRGVTFVEHASVAVSTGRLSQIRESTADLDEAPLRRSGAEVVAR